MAGEIRDSKETVGLTDRITQLPDEIREYILGYLIISDAVRTSVLSQKWRYSWTKATQLTFHFKENMEHEIRVDRYFGLVGRVLLSHVGHIYKCVLRLKWDRHKENNYLKGDMNACLQALSRKGIKDLTIFGREDGDRFELPPSIFECVELSRLALTKCILSNSIAFKGFPNLATLQLSYVRIFGDMLEKVISKCPIEMLSIENCTFYSSETDYRSCKNAISAPNLRVLKIVSYYNGLDYTYLKNTPNLRVASFRTAVGWGGIPDYMKSNCYYVLKSMPKIEVLTFDCQLHNTSALDIIPYKLPELLENLKTVNLHCMDSYSVDQMSFIFCIFRCSPNLQNLEIHFSGRHQALVLYDKDFWEAVKTFLKAVDNEKIKTSITTVSVTFARHTLNIRANIALLDIIISCCPALRNLAISASSSLKGSGKLKLLRALGRYGQSSSKPKIRCSSW
ncbi:unnamed protein product [Rhodiola kirilowii]